MMMAEGVEQKDPGTSPADRSEEEAEEFLPGFTSLEDYSKVIDELCSFIQVNFGLMHLVTLQTYSHSKLNDIDYVSHFSCRLYWVT